jgi:crotonobetainyl-CoA:carnitine CoA-transferase CaiB-like acyl-CoA transferase
MVAEMLAALPRAVVEERCLEAGLPYARISRPEDMFDDPHLLAGDRLLRTILPGGVETRLPGLPLEIGPFKTGLRSDPPVAGQDTRALLQAVGYDDSQIDDLVRRRILVDGAA